MCLSFSCEAIGQTTAVLLVLADCALICEFALWCVNWRRGLNAYTGIFIIRVHALCQSYLILIFLGSLGLSRIVLQLVLHYPFVLRDPLTDTMHKDLCIWLQHLLGFRVTTFLWYLYLRICIQLWPVCVFLWYFPSLKQYLTDLFVVVTGVSD